MSVTASESINSKPPVAWRRLSCLVFASLLCGVATPVVGAVTVFDPGSDLSDLLTLTLPAFLLAAVGLCVAVHITAGKSTARLGATGLATGGAVLAALAFVGVWLLIPSM
jgi:hypothetical protein